MARKLRGASVDLRKTNVSYRRKVYSCHTCQEQPPGQAQTHQSVLRMLPEVRRRTLQHFTDKPWWTVEEAARLLRVNIHTLYRAIARDDFPHQKIGPYIKIPAQALLLTPLPDPIAARVLHSMDRWEQLELPLDPPPIPIKLYRNGEPRKPWDYESSIWR